jgi:hypothetical protein
LTVLTAGGAWWQVWHCVGPQLSAATRKIIHIGYHHRWLRPTDYIAQASQPKPSSSTTARRFDSKPNGLFLPEAEREIETERQRDRERACLDLLA